MNQDVLIVCALDAMAWVLLRSWLKALLGKGYGVHIACSRGPYFDRLEAEGFRMHEVPFRRSFNPMANLSALVDLIRLLRRARFAAVNPHGPIAAAVARAACLFARPGAVIYAVHGFYFHEFTPWPWRSLLVGAERLMGILTDHFMFVSDEDRHTALEEGIARRAEHATTICNGIDVSVFSRGLTEAEQAQLRRQIGVPEGKRVIGTVGRIVIEKGYREFFEMARQVLARRDDVFFLVVGDIEPSDRDKCAEELRRRVREEGLGDRFHFTGFTHEVWRYLQVMDLFVLASYREGLPTSVLEAMASGLPVVATNIRGCREAVVDGETGILVPRRNVNALFDAVVFLLDHPEAAARMGQTGRRRAEECFDERLVQERFVAVFDKVVGVPRGSRLKRGIDVFAATAGLLVTAPLMLAVSSGIRILAGPPVLFAQQRVGLGGREFTLYKFRTMREGSGTDAERLTGWARLLRATSVDELPQLWNVLRGDMSLVGPRPLIADYLPLYSERQRRRHEVKPGITGWAQIRGRNALSWEQKFDLDVWYVDHACLGLDLKILALTVWHAVRGRGISQPGEATVKRFEGSV